MRDPSLRQLENDLEVNKTTLHNWKKNRPKLYNFIIEAYKNKELIKKNLYMFMEQEKISQEGIESNLKSINKI